MAITQLSPAALPGRRYSFVAKAPAAGAKGVGPFTELAVTATPGRRHSFVAKAPAAGGAKGTGPFTALQTYGVPGRRRTFAAKTAFVPDEVEVFPSGPEGIAAHIDAANRGRIHRDDLEILEILAIIAPCLR